MTNSDTMQTRSNTCRRTKAGKCGRLSGHKGLCRPTLHRNPDHSTVAVPKGPSVVYEATLAGFRVVVFDDGTATSTPVVESPAPVLAVEHEQARQPKAAKAKRTVRVQQCRVSRAGTRCIRSLGHKAKGLRHNFGPKVRELPTAGANGRDVQAVGRARRPKAAPAAVPASNDNTVRLPKAAAR